MAEKDFKVKHGLFVTDSANINNLTVRGDASVSGSINVTGNFVGEYAGFDSDFNQKTTTNLTEGDNLYYTTSRADSDFDTRLSTKSTNDLTEGDNLYYTSARADSDFDVRLVTKSTDDLTEGTSLYYTTTRADSDFDVRLATKSTDNLTEGDNLYYTTARADSDFDVRLATKSTDDLTEGDNLYYTTSRADSDAKNAVSVTDAGGDGSISYNNATGTITYTGPSATETRAHLVAGTGVNYDSANGVVSIGQSVGTSDTVTFATVNTGQGANELYAMDQNVRTTDNVAFGQIDGDSATMGQIDFKTDWVTDHITFNEGAVWYDPYHKNLNYYADIDHPIEVGMQMVERVYNDTGSTIIKGKPLYYSGNRVDTAGIESPTVALANATSATKYNVQGLAGEDIANGAYGLAVVAGVIDGFDTSGLNAGANFFVGLEDGAVQNAAPSYPNYPMCLGWVIKSDASDGKVIINQQNHSVNTFRVQGDTHIGDDLVVDGNLTVKGTQTITSTENVSIGGNFQYLNAGNTIGEAGTGFVGTGLDDAFFAGHYSGDSSSKSFFVKIDATGTPDTFEWGFDSDVGTEATGIAITSNEQLLDSDYGISINFGTTTGHTIGDKWTGSATALETDTGMFSNKNSGDAGNGYTHIGVYYDVSQNEWTFVGAYDPEPEAPINRSDGSFAYGDVRAKDIYATNVTGTFIGSASQLGGLTSSQFLRSDTADTKTSGDLSFSDNVKAIFGAGSDLQIYHDGTRSYVDDTGAGSLWLRGGDVQIKSTTSETMAVFANNGAVTLYYDNAAKLATTSTGIDVTGTVTADGLTVDGDAVFTTGDTIRLDTSDGSDNGVLAVSGGGANSDARGARVRLYGNEHASLGGALDIGAGNVSGGHIYNYTNAKLRQKIDYNGDISFYEDTGTTAKFFWDASAEKARFGGTSDDFAGSIGLSGQVFTIEGYLNNSLVLNAKPNTSSEGVILQYNGTDGFILNNQGNVGIGTGSPSAGAVGGTVVHVQKSGGTASVRVDRSDASTAGTLSMTSGNTTNGFYGTGAKPMVFSTNATERMRINPSGNVLVGKTSDNQALAGVKLGTGGSNMSRDNEVLVLNRLSTDGTILNLKKDGTPVGSIGSASGNLSIDTNNKAGLLLAGNVILPKNNGALSDGTVDLGRDDPYRFRDLYLSGGVYLGGTGSANKLDDYEEGTWTATVQGVTTAGTATYGNRAATYTKVGNIVYVQCFINYSSFTGTGDMRVYGLPFLGESGSYETHPGSVHLQNISLPTDTVQVVARSQDGQAFIQLKVTKDNASEAIVQCDAAGQIEIGLTYRSA